jgi:hypothetical protein
VTEHHDDEGGRAGRPAPDALPAADVALRTTIRDYAVSQGEPWHRGHLGRLYGLWDDINARWFGGELTVPVIVLSEPSAPDIYGQCGTVSAHGCRSEIRIRPSLLAGTHPHVTHAGEGANRVADDVLRHEVIHQWQQEITGQTEGSYHGHGPTFRDRCNLIGADLGLPRVRAKKRGRDRDLPSCSQWPHCVRPDEYYLGAYVPASRDDKPERTPCPTCGGTGWAP